MIKLSVWLFFFGKAWIMASKMSNKQFSNDCSCFTIQHAQGISLLLVKKQQQLQNSSIRRQAACIYTPPKKQTLSLFKVCY